MLLIDFTLFEPLESAQIWGRIADKIDIRSNPTSYFFVSPSSAEKEIYTQTKSLDCGKETVATRPTLLGL